MKHARTEDASLGKGNLKDHQGVQPPRMATGCGCGAGWESMTGGSRAGARGGSARAHTPHTTDDKPGDAKNFLELLSTLRHDHERHRPAR